MTNRNLKIESLNFEKLDKKTTSAEMKRLFNPLFSGHDVGIISEAGCPGVADPGALAVEYAHSKNIEVVPLVGPSSILLALMASGMNGQQFCFHGYLPIKSTERSTAIKAIEKESKSKHMTQLFIETPYRNNHMFQTIISSCFPQTKLCIACNLTSADQWVKTMSIKEWKSKVPELHKLPVVFLIQA